MSPATANPVCAVTGLKREARLIEALTTRIVVGGGDSARLGEGIERAVRDGARALFSVGVAGGLKPGLPVGTPIVASSVIAAGGSFATTASWADVLTRAVPGSVRGPVFAQDGIADAAEKEDLYRKTGALAVDMESHVVARIAQARDLPFAVLRIVVDPSERSLPRAAKVAMQPDGSVSLIRIAMSVAARPAQIPLLVRSGMDARVAFRALARCCRVVGPTFGAPNLDELVRDVP
jgi:adenosylhomocysteine nucleosidase